MFKEELYMFLFLLFIISLPRILPFLANDYLEHIPISQLVCCNVDTYGRYVYRRNKKRR